MEQKLVDNFLKSELFTDNKSEIIQKLRLGEGINNLSEFTMLVKMKKPIKR